MRTTVFHWYEAYSTGVYRFSLSILKDPQLAEDVLQETFLRLLTKHSLPDPGKEQAWLYKVARNLCYDHLRRRKKEQAETSAPAASLCQEFEFLCLIAPLSDTEQQILSLRFIGGLTHKEIAQVLGLTVHGAKKRYERAIGKLRKEMEEQP